tara:strand:- start:279 stop:809 length:531 start_codon:yes stop_codon:yes gene_type:complete
MIDPELKKIKDYILSIPKFNLKIAKAAFDAIDFTLDRKRTGFTQMSDLTKTEKSIIGIKFERYLILEANLKDGDSLDCSYQGIDFDIKFTALKNPQWYIPPECYRIEGICLLTKVIDANEVEYGLLRTSKNNLTNGMNRDKKLSVSKEGKKNIEWLGSATRQQIRPAWKKFLGVNK